MDKYATKHQKFMNSTFSVKTKQGRLELITRVNIKVEKVQNISELIEEYQKK